MLSLKILHHIFLFFLNDLRIEKPFLFVCFVFKEPLGFQAYVIWPSPKLGERAIVTVIKEILYTFLVYFVGTSTLLPSLLGLLLPAFGTLVHLEF